MKEWSVPVSEEITSKLAESIQQGPILEIRDGQGHRLLTEETLARVNGLKIELFSSEHPPPHFRVKFQSSTANFSIADCSRLNGSGEVLKYEKNIILWWKNNKQSLIATWNRLRPSNCPVGQYVESNGGDS